MELINVLLTASEFNEIRDRESKRKRDNVLENHGIGQTILRSEERRREEANVLKGNRNIRLQERKLKVHKLNHSRYESQIRLLQEKVAGEDSAMCTTRTSLTDTQASLQESIKSLGMFSPIKVSTKVYIHWFWYMRLIVPLWQLLDPPPLGEDEVPSFRDEDERLARIGALEAELARFRAFDL